MTAPAFGAGSDDHAGGHPGPVTIVTVTFEAEFPLLLLQARSIARHLPADSFTELVVIDNSRRGMPKRFRRKLEDELGAFAPRLTILPAGVVGRVQGADGWRSQQALKLAVSDRIDTALYVVLDSKNHFIGPPDPDYFASADGRPAVTAYSYQTHPLRPQLERVLEYLDLVPVEPYVREFTATVTPFVLSTGLVRNLMASVAAASGRPFLEEFERAKLLEFFLYSGWVLKAGRSWDGVFDLRESMGTIVWPRGSDPATVRAAIATAADRRHPVFSVHRRALRTLPKESADQLADFWTSRGLFRSRSDAHSFLRRYRLYYYRVEGARKVRQRATTAIKRLRRE